MNFRRLLLFTLILLLYSPYRLSQQLYSNDITDLITDALVTKAIDSITDYTKPCLNVLHQFEKNNKVIFGNLTIFMPQNTLYLPENLTLSAQIFNKPAIIKPLKSTSLDEATFTLTLSEPLNIKISSTRTITLQEFSLLVTNNKKELSAPIKLFELVPLANLTYNLMTNDAAHIDYTNTTLATCFSILVPDILHKLPLNSLQLSIKDLFTEPIATIYSDFDFSELKEIIPITINKAFVKLTSSYNNTTGLSLNGILETNINLIPDIVTLLSTEITITEPLPNTTDSFKFLLNCTTLLTIPGINTISCNLSGTLNNNKISYLEGVLTSPLMYQGISLKNVKIRIEPDTKKIELTGSGTLEEDITFEATLRCSEEKKEDESKKFIVSFTGKAIANKGLYPFKNAPAIGKIPGFKNISLNNLEFGLNSDKELMIGGECTLCNINTKAKLIKTINGGVTLFATPTNDFSLGKAFPELSQSPFGSLKFHNPQFVISSAGYFDYDSKLTFPPGVSLHASLDTSVHFFKNIHKIIPNLPRYIELCYPYVPSIPDISIKMALPFETMADIGGLNLENMELSFSCKATEVSIGINSRMRTFLPKQKFPSFFSGSCEFGASPGTVNLLVKGTMLGEWRNALDIKNLTISNIALELGASFLPAPPFIAPKQAGFTGSLALGNKTIMVASKLSTSGDYVLQGELNGSLAIHDMVKLAHSMQINIPINNIPKELGEIRDVSAKIATIDTTIGDIPFKKGITFKGNLTLFNKTAAAEFILDDYGIQAAGSISPITIGKILKLRGKGLDGIAGTKDDGPAFKIALTPLEQLIYFSGEAEIFHINSKTDVFVSLNEISLESSLKLFGLVSVQVKGKSRTTFDVPDFFMRGEIDNKIDLDVSKNDLHKALSYLKKELVYSKQKFNRDILKSEEAIKERQKFLEENSQILNRCLNILDIAKKRVSNAENEVDRLQKKIDSLSKRLGVNNTINNYHMINNTQNLLLCYKNTPVLKQISLLPTPLNYKDLYTNNQILTAFNSNDLKKTIKKGVNKTGSGLKKTAESTQKIATFATSAATESLTNTTKTIANTAEKTSDTIIHSNAATALKDKTNALLNTIIDSTQEAETAATSAINSAKKVGNDALNFISQTGNTVHDYAELAALKLALESALITLDGAKISLSLAEEACKNIDQEILMLRLKEAQFVAELAAEKTALESAIAIVEGAIKTYPAVTWLSKIYIKKIIVSGALLNPTPKFVCSIRIFDKFDETITIDTNPASLGNAIFEKCLPFFKKLS